MSQSLDRNLFQLSVENLQDILVDFFKHPAIDLEKKFPNFSLDCNELCAKYLYDYLTTPLKSQEKFAIPVDKLRSLLNINNDYNKFYDYMLNVLVHEKLLIINNNNLIFNTRHNFSVSPSMLQDKYPMFKGTLSLLDHCITYYPMALSGKIPAISVLYPEGNVAFLEETFSEDTAEYSEISVIRNFAIKLISRISKKFPLKILEIGGGRGIITRELLANINIGNLVEYNFTDISKRFVIDMNRYAKNNNLRMVSCNQFDITKNPANQGINLKGYDIILGLDVVHATPNLEDSLRRLKSLINDNGILCLLETTRTDRWQNLIMGLAKGWWLFNDEWRKSSPLVSPQCWKDAIQKSGFLSTNISTLQNKNSDSALIIAA